MTEQKKTKAERVVEAMIANGMFTEDASDADIVRALSVFTDEPAALTKLVTGR